MLLLSRIGECTDVQSKIDMSIGAPFEIFVDVVGRSTVSVHLYDPSMRREISAVESTSRLNMPAVTEGLRKTKDFS